ncbi:hypothetical protein SAE02_65960 [Skermanella aerolata]|uniref:Uncharacterized protein n=1 Tax=Skermanella aerolata TaxID=393310 RepID=A0A512E137_9PROT|nr:hypothetical protein SAE02_65960 [Skermanella aerolata]
MERRRQRFDVQRAPVQRFRLARPSAGLMPLGHRQQLSDHGNVAPGFSERDRAQTRVHGVRLDPGTRARHLPR